MFDLSLACCFIRFQHDSTSSELSSCFICGWQGIDSAPPSPTHISLSFNQHEDQRDLWVCLVCGFIGCGKYRDSHIQRHYDEHLHTYAMNTESGRVWDFAGDGYVHRLILSESDESLISSHASTMDAPQVNRGFMKVVEISSPHYHSSERSNVAPITSNEEELLINNKLEATANHFNQLVHWQLDRNRELYEMRLNRVREFAAREGVIPLPPSSGNGKLTPNNSSWGECVLYSLQQEKLKLNKQCETVKLRLNKMQDEMGMLLQFQSNLEANKADYEGKIIAAKQKLAEAEREYR